MYYAGGLLLSFIVHLWLGWEHKFLPPVSTAVFLLVLVAGLPWAVLNLMNLILSKFCPRQTGELLAHGIILILAGIALWQFTG